MSKVIPLPPSLRFLSRSNLSVVRNGSDTTSVIVSRTERGNVGVEGASSLSLTAGSCFCPFCPIPVSLHSWVIVPRPKARYPPFSKYPLPEYRGGGRNITWPPPLSLSLFLFDQIKFFRFAITTFVRFSFRFLFSSKYEWNGDYAEIIFAEKREGGSFIISLLPVLDRIPGKCGACLGLSVQEFREFVVAPS